MMYLQKMQATEQLFGCQPVSEPKNLERMDTITRIISSFMTLRECIQPEARHLGLRNPK